MKGANLDQYVFHGTDSTKGNITLRLMHGASSMIARSIQTSINDMSRIKTRAQCIHRSKEISKHLTSVGPERCLHQVPLIKASYLKVTKVWTARLQSNGLYMMSCKWQMVFKWRHRAKHRRTKFSVYHKGSKIEITSLSTVKRTFLLHWQIRTKACKNFHRAIRA